MMKKNATTYFEDKSLLQCLHDAIASFFLTDEMFLKEMIVVETELAD